MKDFEQRFNERFGYLWRHFPNGSSVTEHEAVKAFIKEEINLTLDSVEKELPFKKREHENFCQGCVQENAYNDALSDIRSIIQSHKV